MKTFLIPLQGLFGMSKGSLHVSHIYVRTDAAVDAVLLWTRCLYAYGFVYKDDESQVLLWMRCLYAYGFVYKDDESHHDI